MLLYNFCTFQLCNKAPTPEGSEKQGGLKAIYIARATTRNLPGDLEFLPSGRIFKRYVNTSEKIP